MIDRRSRDLAADLLVDIESEATQPPVTAVERPLPGYGPMVETTFFLSPSRWRLPGVRRDGSGLIVTVGPLRLRAAR